MIHHNGVLFIYRRNPFLKYVLNRRWIRVILSLFTAFVVLFSTLVIRDSFLRPMPAFAEGESGNSDNTDSGNSFSGDTNSCCDSPGTNDNPGNSGNSNNTDSGNSFGGNTAECCLVPESVQQFVNQPILQPNESNQANNGGETPPVLATPSPTTTLVPNTPTPTPTIKVIPTPVPTPSVTPTLTVVLTATPTITPSVTPTLTPTPASGATATPIVTPTNTSIPTPSITPTQVPVTPQVVQQQQKVIVINKEEKREERPNVLAATTRVLPQTGTNGLWVLLTLIPAGLVLRKFK